MKRYKSHKVVQAAKITDKHIGRTGVHLKLDDGSMQVGGGERFDAAKIGDYYVVYDDGYASVSPAEAFEAGYTEVSASHQDSVRAEAVELMEKIEKLTAFRLGETWATLPTQEHRRLNDQLHVMRQYFDILTERIGAFEAEVV